MGVVGHERNSVHSVEVRGTAWALETELSFRPVWPVLYLRSHFSDLEPITLYAGSQGRGRSAQCTAGGADARPGSLLKFGLALTFTVQPFIFQQKVHSPVSTV